MECELAIKFYKQKAFVFGIGALFSIIALIGLIFFPEFLLRISLLAKIIPCAIILVLYLSTYIVMRNNAKLRHAKPWNAIITIIRSFLNGLIVIFLILIKQSLIVIMHGTESASNEMSVIILFAFSPAWLIAFCLSYLAIVMHMKLRNKNIDSWHGIFLIYLAFAVVFSSLYVLFSLALAQPAMAICISALAFLLLGFLCTILVVKITALKIRKYVSKCIEKKQEPNIFDFMYKFH